MITWANFSQIKALSKSDISDFVITSSCSCNIIADIGYPSDMMLVTADRTTSNREQFVILVQRSATTEGGTCHQNFQLITSKRWATRHDAPLILGNLFTEAVLPAHWCQSPWQESPAIHHSVGVKTGGKLRLSAYLRQMTSKLLRGFLLKDLLLPQLSYGENSHLF